MKQIVYGKPIVNKVEYHMPDTPVRTEYSYDTYLMPDPHYAERINKLNLSLQIIRTQNTLNELPALAAGNDFVYLETFGPDWIDDLAMMILQGNVDGVEEYLFNNSYPLGQTILIDDKTWKCSGDKVVPANTERSFRVSHLVLATLCHESKIGQMLLKYEDIHNASFLNMNFFNLLLSINSNLLINFAKPYASEIFSAALLHLEKLMDKSYQDISEFMHSQYSIGLTRTLPLLIQEDLNIDFTRVYKSLSAFITYDLIADTDFATLIKKCLDSGVDADTIINDSKETLLFDAVRMSKTGIWALLLENGADIAHKNVDNAVAFDNFFISATGLQDDCYTNVCLHDTPYFMSKLNLLAAKREHVDFLRKGSNILHDLFTGRYIYGSFEDDKVFLGFTEGFIIYNMLPDLLDVISNEIDPLTNFTEYFLLEYATCYSSDEPNQYFNSVGTTAEFLEYIQLPEVKDFFAKVAKYHPRLLLQQVLANKALLPLISEHEFNEPQPLSWVEQRNIMIKFAMDHGCIDLIPPVPQSRLGQASKLVNKVRKSTKSMLLKRSNTTESEFDPLLISEPSNIKHNGESIELRKPLLLSQVATTPGHKTKSNQNNNSDRLSQSSPANLF